MILLPADLVQRAAERTEGTAVAVEILAGAVVVEGATTEAAVTEAVEGVMAEAAAMEAVETGTAAVAGVRTEVFVTTVAVTETVAAEIIRIVGDLAVAGRKGAVYERENRKVRTLSGGCGKSVSADVFEYLLP